MGIRIDQIEYRDVKETFKKALEDGVLSRDGRAYNYVGHFMYMGHYKNKPQFKNSLTREYLK